MPRQLVKEKAREKSLVLATLAATSASSTVALDSSAKFVLCDVCERLITFVVFHTSRSDIDVCNVCRAALEAAACTRTDFNEVLRIRKADGSDAIFAADDIVQFVGRAPKSAQMLHAVDMSSTDDDEVHPNESALQSRLMRQVAVRGGKLSQAKSIRAGQVASQPSKRPREASGNQKEKPARRRVSPKTSIESAEHTPENPQAVRRTLRSRRPSPVMESAISAIDETTPQPAPPSIDKEKSLRGVAKPNVTQSASAEAASNTTKALFVDEDDMPFFLSQTTLSALAEATSQPVAVPSHLTQPTATSALVIPQPIPSEAKQSGSQPAASPTSRQRPSSTHAQSENVHGSGATIASGPVVNLFAAITSFISPTETRPTAERPARMHVVGEDGAALFAVEGSSVAWRNTFAGVSRRIVAAAICPAVDEYGVWFSFACGGDQSSIELWHAPVAEGKLEAPTRAYSVFLGNGAVVGHSWVPVALARPDNDTLGVCTVLRQRLLLSCKLPRRNVASSTVHVQIAGAQHIRVDSITTSPVSLQWHASHSVDGTYLFVVFECSSVAVYQPVGGGGKKLNLALVTTVTPPGRPTSPLSFEGCRPVVAVGNFATSGATVAAHLAICVHDSLAVMQGPTFELNNFCKVQAGEGHTRGPHAIGAMTATTNGFVLATETAVHHYHARRGEHKQLSAAASAAAQIVGLREVSPSLLTCANSAGQVVLAKLRSNGLEMRSSLWVERQDDPAGGTMPAVLLTKSFDGCQKVAPQKATTSVRYAFHPFSTPLFGSIVLAYFPDGAWVLTSHIN